MGEHQNFTKKLIIKDDYVKKDGTSTLYIYVGIDGKFERINLKITWPVTHFDKKTGKLIARSRNDKDFNDYTLIIETEMAKVNEIFKSYRLAGKKLNLDQLLEDYHSFTSKNDFLRFWEAEVKERWKRKKIEANTRAGHIATLNKLKVFWKQEAPKRQIKAPAGSDQPPLPFMEVTPKLLENFRAFLRNHYENGVGTVEKSIKDVRTYVKRALADGNVFDDPFKVVKVSHPQTNPDVLTEDQLVILLKMFNDNKTPESWVVVLRHFLFSCFTGLRISDAKTVGHEHIKGDWLVIMPFKSRKFQKIIRIPIHPMARPLISTSLGKLFQTYSDQYTNRLLAKIGEAAGVDFKMTTHTARHTFGTLFIELGGDVVTLKDYMGHSKLETTMKYVHISERRKKERINVFDKIFKTAREDKGGQGAA
ncbi:site-specific recombinase XerD [Larkinella arboricola]|uniref:Site-specific recombinase XerD n=1 Tax=Larkinella arboricola TaxID=643671 RepID=A0A327WLN5_LARAB|nr:site-specific integrase [Larkinella arboricola]RAJ92195.1 site-specific recombinase XerD [Larkinella arboricola]